MANVFFNVNTSASIELTYKLEKISKSAFPLAVRSTLNDAAFDVKKNTLQQSAKRNFIQRAPTFWRRFSAVNKAEGMSVNGMHADVGMTSQGEQKAETPIRQLVQQEKGGTIDRGLDYLKGARGGDTNRKVSRANYFDKSRNVSGKFKRPGTSKSRFVAAAYVSLRERKRMTFKGRDGRRFTMQVTSINESRKGGFKIKSKLLYVSRDGHPVKIRGTHFSEEAARATTLKIPEFYRQEADRQISKIWRK